MRETAEGVQNTGCASRLDSVLLGDLFSKWPYGEDGYRVVGCAEIGENHQTCHAKLCAFAALDMFGKLLQDELDAIRPPYDLDETRSHQRDNYQFTHAHDACIHCLHPADEGETATKKSQDACQGGTKTKDPDDVHATQG